MKVLVIFVTVALVAVKANQCPKEQETDWEIEKLLEHEDCDKFYKCTYGQPVEKLCPGNLFFNLELLQCDWQENVNCGNRNIPDGSQKSEEDGGNGGDGGDADGGDGDESAVDGEDGGYEVNCDPEQNVLPEAETLSNGCPRNATVHWLLPHENDCSLFYYCVRGQKVQTECPPTLYFNPIIQVCALPQYSCCVQSFNKHASGRRMMMRK
ncbi:chondroitin proteoglycan 2-like [Battus philenor]|uniref:chondroitin proteoglycan 2-like n=1 Tax=Battus philenor TaxID=42288 RepID=UPI0035CEB393